MCIFMCVHGLATTTSNFQPCNHRLYVIFFCRFNLVSASMADVVTEATLKIKGWYNRQHIPCTPRNKLQACSDTCVTFTWLNE